ncbi:MAG: valine--tRNA ligase [Planctomycetota bacterium]
MSATQAAESALPSTYDPRAVEPRVAERWNAADAFHATPHTDIDCARSPFVICIPPPNVTAALHLGHALNNTLQDVLTRYHRMLGDNAVWLPGTDHAGIATQTVVDKRLKQAGDKSLIDYKRDELEGKPGREHFIEKVQAWKDEYEQRITDQLKAMGCSCDYARQAFTMDEPRARAVREAFFRLFQDGLIYRGKRLVNWDPVSQTALADDEVESKDIDGQFYYMDYPLCDGGGELIGGHVTVATTRPETMLGDTAVAVNPGDPDRAKHIGRFVKLPIANRVIPIVGDDYVVIPDADSDDSKARMASGFLKVTPAHDPNDWEIGQRHDLAAINVMAPDASISIDHGWPPEEKPEENNELKPLVGLAREDARKAIVRWFKERDLLSDQKPYRHAVGHSYRSHVPIEPYLSDQWYVKVTDDRLAGAALRAMAPDQRTPDTQCTWTGDHPHRGDAPADWEGELRFHPPRYAKTFQTWHENIRDWCISRQLWWGHRIPVWRYRLSDQAVQQARLSHADLEAFRVRRDLSEQYPDMIASNGAWEVTPTQRPPFDVAEAVNNRLISSEPDEEGVSHVFHSDIYVCLKSDNNQIASQLEAVGFERDPDVLDTWFSSGLWTLSTMNWPDATDELAAWNPTSVLCTAREIITLWVSRMVMFNLYFSGQGAEGPSDQGGAAQASYSATGPLDHSAPSPQRLPFRDVFIHAMIQDGHGQKMSKSLGNGVDPFDIIDSHGADAMRYTLTSMTTHTQDVRMPVDMIDPHSGETFTPKFVTGSGGVKVAAPTQERNGKKMVSSYGVASGQAAPTGDMPLARNTSEKFDLGRNFCNKVWNAFRFALEFLGEAGEGAQGSSPSAEPGAKGVEPDLASKWILSRLARTIRSCDDALNRYEFAPYATAVYDFFWRDLCDWYIEAIKPTVRDDAGQQATLAACLDASLRLMHPAMPFITERLWEALDEKRPDRSVPGLELRRWDLLCHAAWPRAEASLIGEEAEREWGLLQQIVSAIREVRATHNVPPRQRVQVSSKVPTEHARHTMTRRQYAETLAGYEGREFGPHVERPKGSAAAVVGDITIYVHDLLDEETERKRLDKRREELAKAVKQLEGRLSNKGYVEKAPADKVQETRDQLAGRQQELASVVAQLEELE